MVHAATMAGELAGDGHGIITDAPASTLPLNDQLQSEDGAALLALPPTGPPPLRAADVAALCRRCSDDPLDTSILPSSASSSTRGVP